VVRYNGGPQAGHNVVLPNGLHHAFHQVGSGSFLDGVRTHLSGYMLFEPYRLFEEIKELSGKGVDVSDRVTIDPECIVITPYHWLANRAKELNRGGARHGSCGFGVGEAMADWVKDGLAVRVRDLADPGQVNCIRQTLSAIRIKKARELEILKDSCSSRVRSQAGGTFVEQLWREDPGKLAEEFRGWGSLLTVRETDSVLAEHDVIVFEGAQGVLLDQNIGYFAPHVTWSKTTFANANHLLAGYQSTWRLYGSNLDVEAQYIGVLRTYFTRHGAGPFPTERTKAEPASGERNSWRPMLRLTARSWTGWR
jgi:adenylosuccinate synthase